jgi:hypothetical protein
MHCKKKPITKCRSCRLEDHVERRAIPKSNLVVLELTKMIDGVGQEEGWVFCTVVMCVSAHIGLSLYCNADIVQIRARNKIQNSRRPFYCYFPSSYYIHVLVNS